MIGLDDIDRWSVGDIEAVFNVCAAQHAQCTDHSANLKGLNTFESWDGDAAAAAKRSVGRTRVDLDSHGRQVEAIGKAAKAAATKIESIKVALAKVRSDADADGFAIANDGTVTSTRTDDHDDDRESKRIALQLRVNQILLNAEDADDELAAAIKAADGEVSPDQIPAAAFNGDFNEKFGAKSLGLPDYPPGSLSDVEARRYYLEGEKRIEALAKSLATSGMTPEQQARVLSELRNEIRTNARTYMADRAKAAALDRTDPNKSFDDLIKDKMERKGLTRDAAIKDIIDSASKSRPSVNAQLGLDPKDPGGLPDPKEVAKRPGVASVATEAGEGIGRGALRLAGKAALPIAAGIEIYDGYNQVHNGTETVPEAVGTGVGAVGGMWAGAEFGAAAGVAGGPVGVAAGALIGGVVGGVLGSSLGKEIGSWFH